MAVIFADGAALYDSAATAATAKGYSAFTTGSGGFPAFRAAGAWGAGSYSVQILNSNAGTGGLVVPLPNGTTYTLGFRFKSSGSQALGSSTGTCIGGLILDATHGVWLGLNLSNQIAVNSCAGGTNLFLSSAITVTNWNYIEVQYTASTSGSSNVQLWINGVSVNSASVGTTNGATIAEAVIGICDSAGHALQSSGGTTLTYSYTDIYITDTTNASGAGNTGALGPVRVETLLPTGAGTTSNFTPIGTSACTANQFNPTATTGFVADTNCTLGNTTTDIATAISPYNPELGLTSELAVTTSGTPAVVTTTVGTGGYPVTPGTSYTASAIVGGPTNVTQVGIRWYTSGGAVIQTDVGAVATTTPSAAFVNAVAPATAAFAAIVVQDTGNNSFRLFGCTFVATPAGFTGAVIKNPSLGATNWGNVSEPVADGGTFNRDGGATGVGDVDSYAMADLATTSGTPLAVMATNIASKENTNPRSVAPLIRVSGTNYLGASQALNNDMAFHAYGNVWELNPNGSVAWTISTVNAAEAGIEIAA